MPQFIITDCCPLHVLLQVTVGCTADEQCLNRTDGAFRCLMAVTADPNALPCTLDYGAQTTPLQNPINAHMQLLSCTFEQSTLRLSCWRAYMRACVMLNSPAITYKHLFPTQHSSVLSG
jgi:hypothetical protein